MAGPELKASLQLRIGQQLTMTPQLQQAIRLLQMPVLELEAHCQEALESNVMLEESDETFEPPVENSNETTAETDESGETREDEPIVVEGDWTDTNLPAIQSRGPAPDGTLAFEIPDPGRTTLREHLLWQLQIEKFSDREKMIGRAVVDQINEDGYFTGTIEDVLRTLLPDVTATPDEATAVLHRIQRLDPAGVGASSLSECIVLQLRTLEPDTPALELAHRIASDHLDRIANKDYASLARQLEATPERLDQAAALVRSMNPRPGAAVNSVAPEYIVPDVYIRRIESRWVVDLNSSTLPTLRVNEQYASAVARKRGLGELRSQLQEAKWLVRSLEIRNETLLRVARAIVEQQHEFLEQGEEAMRPMVLRDIARKLELHESTISRVTTNKYMHTPRGLFEFRFFFSSHVDTSDGGGKSSVAIRAMIRKMISKEDQKRPLSDNRIAQALANEGVKVARRTIAKYREALGIPSSSERRRAAQ